MKNNRINYLSLFLKVLMVISLFVFLSFGVAFNAETESDFMTLSQIKKGAEGIGKTVVSGTRISDFQVKVVGIIDEPGYLNDFIIIRSSGEAIKKSGGISQGMSGSPIYIDDKLIGALSRAAQWSSDPENPIGLVTPIFTMLKLLKGENQEEVEVRKVQREQNQTVKAAFEEMYGVSKVHFSNSPPLERGIFSHENSVVVYSLQSSVMVNGLGDRSFSALKDGLNLSNYPLVYHPLKEITKDTSSRLSEGFSQYSVIFHQVSDGVQIGQESLDLQAGSPFGVALTKGDISIGALGTVTYREGNNILGFGHSFLLNGSSDFFLTQAYVFDTVKNLKASYKLATITGQVGSLTEDRAQGVLGEIGAETDTLDMDLEITDLDANSTDSLMVNAVKEPQLVGNLTLSVVLEAIDRSLKRIGPGTVRLDYTMTGDGLPKELSRTDTFFSTQDVAILPSLQLAVLTDALANNPFKKVNLTGLEVEMGITEDINYGRVFSLKSGDLTYQAGDSIVYQVRINNYRNDMTTETGILPLPQGLKPGGYILVAYGGPQPSEIAPTKDIETLEDYISYIEDINSYEYLSVELLKPLGEQLVSMSGGYSYQSVKKTDERYPNQVIYGRQAVPIVVEERQK